MKFSLLPCCRELTFSPRNLIFSLFSNPFHVAVCMKSNALQSQLFSNRIKFKGITYHKHCSVTSFKCTTVSADGIEHRWHPRSPCPSVVSSIEGVGTVRRRANSKLAKNAPRIDQKGRFDSVQACADFFDFCIPCTVVLTRRG